MTEMEAEANRATVGRLMTILSGETPVQAGSEIIARDVVAHVDGWTFQGINVWANWIDYIRTRGRVNEPTLLIDQLVVHPDARITARGRWQGVRDGRVLTSSPGVATYRLENGRIVEIWSTRGNYAFLCGSHLALSAGFALELLRSKWWRLRAPRLDLAGEPRPQSVSLSTSGVVSSPLAAAD